MWTALWLSLILLAVSVAVVVLVGRSKWAKRTQSLLVLLDANQQERTGGIVDALPHDLPQPVARYLRRALPPEQPVIHRVAMRHTGTFNLSEDGNQWKPFTSQQTVVTRRRGFVWDARVSMLPGVAVHVHDAYAGGEGILHAALLGAITVADMRGGREIAVGELMRFFAEAAWYPTALLPSEGVQWEAVDDRSAWGTISDGEVRVRLLFTFDDQDHIASIRAESRSRISGSQLVSMPWFGTFSNYQERGGMLIPMEGEVSWLTSQGPRPYWRGTLREIRYSYTDSDAFAPG